MKKVTTLLLLAVTLVFTSFTPNKKTANNKVTYAFVTDIERDKAYDEPTNNGYVSITTNIVTIYCDARPVAIENQYIQHYDAEEKTANRDRAFIGTAGITTAWVYNTYDEALASRRDWLAKSSAKNKRRVYKFYVTCD